ncbi:unnamed protein product [Paramecium pentaurelia]|uniref:Uncharacterized protein n=1 Tax=Paramecium pentaurelia TaxID=43138 RepID=A0A8S1VFQ4_9CILI|nr:unnamed protein product [Paramecium pentaurelia]
MDSYQETTHTINSRSEQEVRNQILKEQHQQLKYLKYRLKNTQFDGYFLKTKLNSLD